MYFFFGVKTRYLEYEIEMTEWPGAARRSNGGLPRSRTRARPLPSTASWATPMPPLWPPHPDAPASGPDMGGGGPAG